MGKAFSELVEASLLDFFFFLLFLGVSFSRVGLGGLVVINVQHLLGFYCFYAFLDRSFPLFPALLTVPVGGEPCCYHLFNVQAEG